MSNAWFQFKKFRIAQDKCAMKVTTDACIQGAWTPVGQHVRRVLDIGTGTGLLSLMLAQRLPQAHIEGVEVEAAAAQQATENVSDSPWHDRIRVVQLDIAEHAPDYTYDLIICNPPFFTNSLLNPDTNKSLARHDNSMSKQMLVASVLRLLSVEGHFSILLPTQEHKLFAEIAAEQGLKCVATLEVRHRPNASVKRIISIWNKDASSTVSSEVLTIQNDDGSYTEQFRELLKAFYLNI